MAHRDVMAEVRDYKAIQSWHDRCHEYYLRHVGVASTIALDEYFGNSWMERFYKWMDKEKAK